MREQLGCTEGEARALVHLALREANRAPGEACEREAWLRFVWRLFQLPEDGDASSKLTVFIGPADVEAQLGCSRSTAYKLLQEALGRRAGRHGLLRCPLVVWEAFIASRFVETERRGVVARKAPPVALTKPRGVAR
jgi:hypothetical protein